MDFIFLQIASNNINDWKMNANEAVKPFQSRLVNKLINWSVNAET